MNIHHIKCQKTNINNYLNIVGWIDTNLSIDKDLMINLIISVLLFALKLLGV